MSHVMRYTFRRCFGADVVVMGGGLFATVVLNFHLLPYVLRRNKLYIGRFETSQAISNVHMPVVYQDPNPNCVYLV